MMRYELIPVGILQTNCYLAWSSKSSSCLVIDPGGSFELIESRLGKLNLKPVGVLLTHGHVDHIGAVGELSSKYGIPVWIHEGDRGLYLDPRNAILPWVPAAEGLPEPVQELPKVEGLSYEVIHTPGHTPGGVCFYFAEHGVLFSGDTLFQGTHGRTDFPGGSYATLMKSIKEKLLSLPKNVVVLPGHQEATTIGDEQDNY